LASGLHRLHGLLIAEADVRTMAVMIRPWGITLGTNDGDEDGSSPLSEVARPADEAALDCLADVRSARDFAVQLRKLYRLVGEPSYRDVAIRSKRAGREISASTAGNLVRGATLPTRPSVEGFLLGCGAGSDAIRPWMDKWDRHAERRSPTRETRQVPPTGTQFAGWMTVAIGSDGRDHFQQKAFGQRNVGHGGDLFRGRTAAREFIRDWLTATVDPGLPLVVTGQPGAGKSSVVARSAQEVAIGTGAVGLMFFARDATHDDLLQAVAECVGFPGLSTRIDVIEVF
jgi:hypothetical protein